MNEASATSSFSERWATSSSRLPHEIGSGGKVPPEEELDAVERLDGNQEDWIGWIVGQVDAEVADDLNTAFE
jgi:hypothetical protein